LGANKERKINIIMPSTGQKKRKNRISRGIQCEGGTRVRLPMNHSGNAAKSEGGPRKNGGAGKEAAECRKMAARSLKKKYGNKTN